jgi:hypothetical protein
LISQGGLDGILDDDSLLSSSPDSSYEDDDGDEHEANRPTHQIGSVRQQHHQHQQQLHAHFHNKNQNHANHQHKGTPRNQFQDHDDHHHENDHANHHDKNNNNNENGGLGIGIDDKPGFGNAVVVNDLNDMSIYGAGGPLTAASVAASQNSILARATPITVHQLKQKNPNTAINQNYILLVSFLFGILLVLLLL